jgi:hypothetical protein
MPRMDDGPTDGPPGRPLKTVWATLSIEDARHLLLSLEYWAEELENGDADPGWHMHITDADGNELTIAVALHESRSPVE